MRCEQGRRKTSPAERRRRSAAGRGARARQPDIESSESSDTDDVSISPTALSVSSKDTSDDDDDDDDDDSRRNISGSTVTAASRSVDDEAAATYGVRQHSNTSRPARETSASSPSLLRFKLQKRLVTGRRPQKRDRVTAHRKTPLGRRKLSGNVRGKSVAGKTTSSEMESPDVKRCRPAHWSPVHSTKAADVWLPPPGVRSLMDKVSITDVTANTLTVTVRECTTGEGFFRRSADTEPPTATASSSTTPADPT